MAVTSSQASQRERLLNGMAHAVARRGYAEATVAQTIAHAGVSRSTFYEHFANKEECFLAAFRELAPVLAGELMEAVGEVPWPEKQRAMLSVVLDPDKSETAMHWRLLLTQSRAGEPRIRAERDLFAATLEQAFERLLDAPPPGALTLDIPPKALLGGVRSVISIRRYTFAAGEEDRLLDGLQTWTAAYAIPADQPRRDSAAWMELGRALCACRRDAKAGGERGTAGEREAAGEHETASGRETGGERGAASGRGTASGPLPLPRGRNRLPANILASEYHSRIVDATARTIRAKGYPATTIADIVAAAGVSRGVFYGQFQNKQEAFLATQTVALQRGLTTASAAFFTGRTWPEQVWNGLDALFDYLAGVPDITHLMLIEPYAAGGAALDRIIDTMRTLSLFLEEGYHRSARSERLPRTCSDAIAGAIHELMYDAAEHDRVPEIHELLPQAVYVAIAPFIGPVKARGIVDELVTRATASGAAPAGSATASGAAPAGSATASGAAPAGSATASGAAPVGSANLAD